MIDDDWRTRIDVASYNRDAWDHQVASGSLWTRPVSQADISEARTGQVRIRLANHRFVPSSWFPPLKGCRTLCLAAGGGQQGPLLAAAGAIVTVLDVSASQLARDREVAEREGLHLSTIQGDMRDLSAFADGAFQLIVLPVSNNFVPDPIPIWRECHRVLELTGVLMAGFATPIAFCFDPDLENKGILQMRFCAPYSDIESLDEARLRSRIDLGRPLCFGHSLETQIGGQLTAGFVLTDFLDEFNKEGDLLARYIPGYALTRAIRRESR